MNVSAENIAPPARAGRKKSILFRIAFVGAATLILLELSLQLFLTSFDYLKFTQPDDYLFVRFIPGKVGLFSLRDSVSIFRAGNVLTRYWVRIDSQSLRAQRNYRVPKPPGVYRVLCLGDSITFGWGLPLSDTWPLLLERELSARLPGREVEVINAGHPGYTSRQGMIWLDRELLRFEPDVVIVEFGFNDSLPAWFRPFGPIRPENDQKLMTGKFGNWVPIRRGPLEKLADLLSQTLTVKFAFVVYSRLFGENPVYEGAARKTGDEDPRLYQGARVPPADYRENLLLIVARCQEAGARPILVSAWGTPEAYRAEARAAAKTTGVTIVYQSEIIQAALAHPAAAVADPRFQTIIAELKKRPHPFPPGLLSLVLVDFLHPNVIGNTLFVDRLAEIMVPSPRP